VRLAASSKERTIRDVYAECYLKAQWRENYFFSMSRVIRFFRESSYEEIGFIAAAAVCIPDYGKIRSGCVTPKQPA
jgi:hypothetical protein